MFDKIEIKSGDEIKVVTKPWGSETWLAYGEGMPYCLKMIKLNKGAKTSLQYHEKKRETNFVYLGKIRLHYRDELEGETKTREYGPMTAISVAPMNVHRVEALEDTIMIEASTNDLEDVIRISDDYKRPDGYIASEHGEKK